MTAYRLPDFLGGHPVTYTYGIAHGPAKVVVHVDGKQDMEHSYVIHLPENLLVEVKLPPEPSNHTAIITHGPVPIVMQRVDQRHTDDGAHWFGAGNVTPMTWAQVCEFCTPTVLVPDPAAGAPALPWRGNDGSGGGELIVQADRLLSGGFTEFGGSRAQTVARLDAVKLRELAGALLRRAAEVES